MNSVYGKYLTKTAIVWTGCFVLFFIVHMATLAPQKETRKNLEQKLAEKKRIHNSALNAAKKETKVQLNEEIKALRKKSKDFITDFENSTNLTFEISRIANEKNVSSFSIDTKRARSQKGKKSENKHVFESKYDVSFVANNFNQFATLINALERHRPVIFIDNFSINRSKKDDAEHRVKMDVTVFFIKNKQPVNVAKL